MLLLARAGLTALAVAGPVERGVRPQSRSARTDGGRDFNAFVAGTARWLWLCLARALRRVGEVFALVYLANGVLPVN